MSSPQDVVLFFACVRGTKLSLTSPFYPLLHLCAGDQNFPPVCGGPNRRRPSWVPRTISFHLWQHFSFFANQYIVGSVQVLNTQVSSEIQKSQNIAKDENQTDILLATTRREVSQPQVGLFSRLNQTCWSFLGRYTKKENKTINWIYSGEPSNWHPQCSTKNRMSGFAPA